MSAASRATTTALQPIGAWVQALGSKSPTPGGGAAAAVTAAIGAASGAMAAIYTTRKKDELSGVAQDARKLAESLNRAADQCALIADQDAAAYAALQQTWKKESGLSAEDKARIEREALDVPVRLLHLCHEQASAVADFLPRCNPNITSDAKVSLHLLAGAGRSAFQTALVNNPPEELKVELRQLLADLAAYEAKALGE
mmetsp:Transcript_10108/g.16856  ORF Transcript_10108/g.16856 Transcript_10108/m.16856 type:complete len:199 (+) Transcript_10108:44-640(+)